MFKQPGMKERYEVFEKQLKESHKKEIVKKIFTVIRKKTEKVKNFYG